MREMATQAASWVLRSSSPKRVISSSVPKLRRGLRGGRGDFFQSDAGQLVLRHIALDERLGASTGASAARYATEGGTGAEAVGDAHEVILRAMVRMISDCSQSGA
ncbi:hypothetical protein GCM10018987_56990 [Streptomyces cremeus]